MWHEEFKPLSTAIWLSELEKLAKRCAENSFECDDRAVRQAYNLGRLSPLALRKMLGPFVSESELESVLEDGQNEKAAKLAIGSNTTADLLNCSDAMRSRATLTFQGGEQAAFEASSPALAIIGAWASFLTTTQPN